MFYLSAVIEDYSQWRRIDAQRLAVFQSNIEALLKDSGGRFERISPSEYRVVFSFDYQDAEYSVVGIAYKLKKLSIDYDEDCFRLWVAIDYSEEVMIHSRSALYWLSPDVHSVWLSPEVVKHSSSLDKEGGPHVYRLKSMRTLTRGERSVKKLRSRYDLRMRIEAQFRRHMDNESIYLHLYGPPFSGKRYNFRQVTHEQLGGDSFLTLYSVHFDGDKRLMAALEPRDWKRIRESLTEEEKIQWNMQKTVVEWMVHGHSVSPAPDRYDADQWLFIALLITVYMRIQRGKGCIPLIVFEGEDFPQYEFLRDYLIAEKGLFFVWISHFPKPIDLDFPLIPLEVQRLTEIQNRQIVSSCKPGGVLEKEPVDRLYRNVRGSNLFLYHAFLLQGMREAAQTETKDEYYFSKKLLQRLDALSLGILYSLTTLPKSIPEETFFLFFEEEGFSHSCLKERLHQLKELVFLDSVGRNRLVFPDVGAWIESLSPDLTASLRKKMGRRIIQMAEEGKIAVYHDMMLFLKRYLPRETYLDFLIKWIRENPQENSQMKPLLVDLADSPDENTALIDYINHLRFVKQSGNMHWMETERVELMKFFERGESFARNDLKGDFYSIAGEYELELGAVRQAMSLGKKALMIYQENQDDQGVIAGWGLLGRCALKQEGLEPAEEFWEIALGHPRVAHFPVSDMENRFDFTALLFLMGRMTHCLELVKLNRKAVERFGRREIGLRYSLLEGRIFFELGQYREAGLIFRKAMEKAHFYRFFEAVDVFRRWSFRSRVFSNKAEELQGWIQEESSLEGGYFLAEYYYYRKRWDLSLSVLEGIRLEDSNPHLNWSSGFCLIEDRVGWNAHPKGILERLIQSLRGEVMIHLGRIEEGRRLLSKLNVSSSLKNDPYFGLYIFRFAEVLPDLRGSGGEDFLTVLSRAVHFIQGRATQITDSKQKKGYIYDNWYHKNIWKAAKEKKLI